MKQYLDAVREILERGTRKENRTGVDTLSTFNINYEHDLWDGFPLLTTKKINWAHIVLENLWFLSGSTDISFLRHYGVKFWDAWANDEGQVPSAYGNFWRHFPVPGSETMYATGDGTVGSLPIVIQEFNDQIRWLIDEAKRNPMSRRLVVSAWAPGNAQTSKLPPCHAMFVCNVQNVPVPLKKGVDVYLKRDRTQLFRVEEVQNDVVRVRDMHDEPHAPVYRADEFDRADSKTWQRLCLHLTQRSCDIALGVPYNIAGYAFQLELLGWLTGIQPGLFAHTLVDAHAYTSKPDGSMAEYDHVPGLQLQLEREPRPLPQLSIDSSIETLEDIERLIRDRPPVEQLLELFKLENYDPHPAIPFKVAV